MYENTLKRHITVDDSTKNSHKRAVYYKCQREVMNPEDKLLSKTNSNKRIIKIAKLKPKLKLFHNSFPNE